MGKLIRCSGRLAEKPYLFPMTKTRVYSIEEVCYYIRNNIYMMQEEIFDQEFACWLREELDMGVTADKLDQMRADHNNLKDIVVTLCCSCDYYTETQIEQLIKIMDETQNLPLRGRRKIKADSFLKSGSLDKAKQEYESILKSDDILGAAEEEYGDIYHCLGVVCARTGEFLQAAQAFQKAYEKNRRSESKEAYFYALMLGDLREEFQRAVKELGVSGDEQVYFHAQYEEAQRLAREEKGYRQIARLQSRKEDGSRNAERIHDLIQRWKEDYRRGGI